MKSIEELREDLETLCILRGDFTLASGKKVTTTTTVRQLCSLAK